MQEPTLNTVVALVTDLFFSVKLSNEIRRAGFAPQVVKTPAEFRDAIDDPGIALGVIDLGARIDVDELQSFSIAAREAGTPLIAFGPHKNVDAFRAAQAAGLTRVMSNGVFHAQTAEMIRRYARRADHDAENN